MAESMIDKDKRLSDESMDDANEAFGQALNRRLKAIRAGEWAPLATVQQNVVDYGRLRQLENDRAGGGHYFDNALSGSRDKRVKELMKQAEDKSQPEPTYNYFHYSNK